MILGRTVQTLENPSNVKVCCFASKFQECDTADTRPASEARGHLASFDAQKLCVAKVWLGFFVWWGTFFGVVQNLQKQISHPPPAPKEKNNNNASKGRRMQSIFFVGKIG